MRDRSAITVNARQWDDDLRIATLEIQVDALQDATTQTELSSKAVAAEHDKRVKKYADRNVGSLVAVKSDVAIVTGISLP